MSKYQFDRLCPSCYQNKKSKDRRTDTYSSGAISFVSDESFSPIIEEERTVFQFDYPQAKVTPVYTNESDAINRLLDGKAWLAFAARDFKASELQNLQARNFRPVSIKVAYDALAFIVNKASSDTIISVQDIRNVMSGKATKWSDISNGASSGTITVVFDNAKSSTVHFVEDSILGGKPITNPNVAAVNKTAEVIKYVEENPGAIGVIGNNWLNDKHDSTNLTFNKNIRVMRVSKVHPATPASSRLPYQYYIYNGEYPLVRTIYALLNDPRRGLPWGFAHFIEGPKGQRIVMKAGLLPVLGQINVRDVNVSQ
ncbi:substrate-binding domain-containing protein [Hallella sp.]|uniref:PstS family phosphate ABC transporter substrate-binding protein n=1 Tax=Hallella sp. TaxID=2980186 RepID=UPI00307C257B